MNQEELLKKYENIIKEEVNVKEIGALDSNLKVQKIFKPIGSKLSAKFGKDTGKIIQYGKQGNIKQNNQNQMIVFDDSNNERILETEDYEISYEGLEGDDIAIDNEIIAKLDLTMTPQLIKEGFVREISRFINQMRKDAKYNVDDKINLIYQTTDEYLVQIMSEFGVFLQDEALIKDISNSEKTPSGDILAEFASDEHNMMIAIKR